MNSDLWQKAARIEEKAEAKGSLLPLKTELLETEQQGLSYQIRILQNLKHKAESASQSDTNPFLPYDPDLFVCQLTAHYNCLLNKFNVFERHLLLTTTEFTPQESVLNKGDFEAVYHALSSAQALLFYNSGAKAGASQQHKHLQLVHFEYGQQPPLLAYFAELHDEVPRHLSVLPYHHAGLALPKELFTPNITPADDAICQLGHLYDRLRMTLSLTLDGDIVSKAYNLLMTRDWMVLVPRTRETVKGISFNALAFSGSLLVKEEIQAEFLKRSDIAELLAAVTQ